MLLYQRTYSRRKGLALVLMIIPAILIRNWIVYRGVETEGLVAFALAILLNFLFWWLIGRYNPVREDSGIKVLGLDD